MIQPLFVFGDIGIAFLRVILGIILVAHGWPKIKNIKSGTFWTTLVALVEFVGGISIILGLLVQPVAALVVIEFVVTTFKINWSKGFVSGYEFDLLILAAAFALLVLGGGAYGLDKYFGLLLY